MSRLRSKVPTDDVLSIIDGALNIYFSTSIHEITTNSSVFTVDPIQKVSRHSFIYILKKLNISNLHISSTYNVSTNFVINNYKMATDIILSYKGYEHRKVMLEFVDYVYTHPIVKNFRNNNNININIISE